MDKERVIKGLEALRDSMYKNQCYACSYEFIETVQEFGTNIIDDALEFLKGDINELSKNSQESN